MTGSKGQTGVARKSLAHLGLPNEGGNGYHAYKAVVFARIMRPVAPHPAPAVVLPAVRRAGVLA